MFVRALLKSSIFILSSLPFKKKTTIDNVLKSEMAFALCIQLFSAYYVVTNQEKYKKNLCNEPIHHRNMDEKCDN